jgi:protein transport protein SEC24
MESQRVVSFNVVCLLSRRCLYSQPPPPTPGSAKLPPPPPAPGMFQPPPAGVKPPVMMFQPPPSGVASPPPQMNVFQPPPPMGNAMAPPGAGAGAPLHGQLSTPASSSFYQMPPSQAVMDRAVASAPPGQFLGGGSNIASTTSAPGMMMMPSTDSSSPVDLSITIPERLIRFSSGKITNTAAQATSSKIPFGAVMRPMAPPGPDETDLPTVQPGNAGIVRCKKCRTYMNAFVTWSEHGRRWHCNICSQMNDCPSAYFCHLDEQGYRRDRYERPELSHGAVEFLAPAEYMVRPPQEPTYFFVFDVSANSVRTGVLASAARAIKASLSDLPGRNRTKIGFITFDNAVHYYNLAPELKNPQMLVVSDLKELFVPLPDNLLVNLQESRHVVESFLDSLPEMFAKNPVQGQSCLGPALKAAFTVVKQIGGKMCVFQSILPNLGDGALKPREQPGIMGTPAEINLLIPENPWYKDTAIEFSRQQISVDLYLFPRSFMDVATLGELPRITSGSLFSYVAFDHARDGPRFEAQLNKTLTQETAFEAVMRIRCAKGMRITNFYGNFFVRGSDLMALPNCNTESVFGFDLVHDEQSISMSYITVQAALLYTSSNGERRIRVMTQAIPVTSLLSEVVNSIDTDACLALLARQGLQAALKSNLENARMRLQQTCIEVMKTCRDGDKRIVSGYAAPPVATMAAQTTEEKKPIPPNLQLFPLYTLALMKNVAFRGGTDVHPDERSHSHHIMNGLWMQDSKHFIYPRMFSIHDMSDNVGLPVEETPIQIDDDIVAGRNRIKLPQIVPLSVDHLTSSGIYLLDNGVDMYLWVGRTADMNAMSSLFDVHSLEGIDPSSVR